MNLEILAKDKQYLANAAYFFGNTDKHIDSVWIQMYRRKTGDILAGWPRCEMTRASLALPYPDIFLFFHIISSLKLKQNKHNGNHGLQF